MASSPIRAPAAAVAGQQQSRLLDMQVSNGGTTDFYSYVQIGKFPNISLS